LSFFKSNKEDKNSCTDEELLQQYIKSGNSDYFGVLYNRYIPLIYGVCLKYLQNESKAQDAVMEIFEYLLLKIPSYDIQVFKPWLYTVVKNHCFKVLKSNKRELLVDFDSNVMESDTILSLSGNESDKDYEEALDYCMAKLSEPQRATIELFFVQSMSYADIVDNTSYDLKSVKSYLQNGKRNLKICIESRLKNEIS